MLVVIVVVVSSFGLGANAGLAGQPVHAGAGVHDAKIVRLLSIPVE